ncbi:MAG TPA: glycosyltransferase family 4 protein [Mycobacteriales bacterium]|nr:glycosyltransferase family 4 protein [Mycobacteriales bacterium]
MPPWPVRLLWVTAEPPDRALGGGNIRQARLLDAITCAADVDLLVAGGVPDDKTVAAVRRVTQVPVRVRRDGSTLRRRVLNLQLALGRQGPVERWAARPARDALAAALDDSSYDIVIVQHAGLATLLPPRRNATWIAELHNVASGSAADSARLAAGRRQRWVREREAAAARRLEAWIVRSYDAVVSVSPADAALLPGDSVVIPNGVDVPATTAGLPEAPRLLFSGTLGYGPNVDGLLWFAREVWPLVRQRVPEARWDIAGRAPTPAVSALGELPGVAVHPDVPDMAPYVAAARVAVVPLRFGTGTRLKVLEAWAAGRPVVGTSIGLMGLDYEPGVHALVADDAGGLADATVTALGDGTTAGHLADAGRALVLDKYDWSQIGRAYGDFLRSFS